MLSDIVWPAVLLCCEINDNQILLNIECSELKNLVDIDESQGQLVILISYFSFYQPWLPHPVNLRP